MLKLPSGFSLPFENPFEIRCHWIPRGLVPNWAKTYGNSITYAFLRLFWNLQNPIIVYCSGLFGSTGSSPAAPPVLLTPESQRQPKSASAAWSFLRLRPLLARRFPLGQRRWAPENRKKQKTNSKGKTFPPLRRSSGGNKIYVSSKWCSKKANW